MKIELGKSWARKLENRIGQYQFDVGVLEDKPHNEPDVAPFGKEPNLGEYAGGPVRKATRTKGPKTTGEILVENMVRLNINLLSAPFQDPSSEINRFTKAFLTYAASMKGSIRRVENLLQAVVRNPILRQDYGPNKSSTADAKGFDRNLFDTGQMFKAIKARAKRV